MELRMIIFIWSQALFPLKHDTPDQHHLRLQAQDQTIAWWHEQNNFLR